MSKKNIILVSFFNSNNLGDKILSSNLNYYILNKNINVLKYDFITSLKVEKIDLEIFNNEFGPKLIKSKLIKICKNIYGSIKHFISIDFSVFENEIQKCDALIIGGGNMLMGLSLDFPLLFYKYVKIAKKYKKNIFLISVGAGPLGSWFSRIIFKNSLNKVDFITTRDLQSKKNIESLVNGKYIEVSGDSAILCDSVKLNKVNHNIGISVYPYKDPRYNSLGDIKEYKEYLINFKNFIEMLLDRQKGYTVELFSTEINDYNAINELMEVISNKYKERIKVIKINNYENLMSFYNSIDLLLGTRLHSIILAFTQGIPIIGLSWQPKVNGFFELIRETNSVYDIKSFQYNIHEILSQVDSMLINKINISNNLKNINKELIESFGINNTYLKKVLN